MLNCKQTLDNLSPVYFPNEVNIVEKLFLPVSQSSDSFDCLSGYFSSKVISELAEPLSLLFKDPTAKGRFLISPNLDDDDKEALLDAYANKESILEYLVDEKDITPNSLTSSTLDVMKYLITTNRLDIRIVLMKEGMMHAKIWIFNTKFGKAAIHGSGNATKSGLMRNFEQLVFSRMWGSENDKTIVEAYQLRFNSFWESQRDDSYTLMLNDKSISDILSSTNTSVNEETYPDLLKMLNQHMENELNIKKLKTPSWLKYREGDYKHQGEAIDAWLDNDMKGIFSIATGGGKTLTSLTAASISLQAEEKALIVIAVPTKPLISQWGKDVNHFGISPYETAGVPSKSIVRHLKSLKREMRVIPGHRVIILTHNALKNENISEVVSSFNCPKMLIADEAHNLGSIGFTSNLPHFYNLRLALSATIERQYDAEGTAILKDFFDGIVFEFSVEEAIGKCLVPFDYYAHKVYLNESEVDKWIELSQKIRRLYGFGDSDSESKADLLAIRRRAISENACEKINKFHELFKAQIEKEYTLVFCTDKDKEQLILVNEVLRAENIRFRQITSQETGDRKLTSKIISNFTNKELQVLTSKRVLDEGFNIPPIKYAFIVSSNGVERQWLQRLGRVLRQSEDTGKTHAVIHDFIVIPPDIEQDKSLRTLINNEFKRVVRFTELSRNGGGTNGSLAIIHELTNMLE